MQHLGLSARDRDETAQALFGQNALDREKAQASVFKIHDPTRVRLREGELPWHSSKNSMGVALPVGTQLDNSSGQHSACTDAPHCLRSPVAFAAVTLIVEAFFVVVLCDNCFSAQEVVQLGVRMQRSDDRPPKVVGDSHRPEKMILLTGMQNPMNSGGMQCRQHCWHHSFQNPDLHAHKRFRHNPSPQHHAELF